MTRCLSDRALAKMLAELATPADRAHVAVCSACAMRLRRLDRDVGAIADVLGSTTEIATRRRPVRWRWRAAIPAMAAASVAALLWVETTMWTASRSMTDPQIDEEITLALEDLWSSFLSTDRESRSADASAPFAAVSDVDLLVVCDDRSASDEPGCGDVPDAEAPSVELLGSDATVDAVPSTDTGVLGG